VGLKSLKTKDTSGKEDGERKIDRKSQGGYFEKFNRLGGPGFFEKEGQQLGYRGGGGIWGGGGAQEKKAEKPISGGLKREMSTKWWGRGPETGNQ